MAIAFPVSPAKARELAERLARLDVREGDLREKFFRVDGVFRGVELLHPASGVRVRSHQGKSQGLNRFLARRMLAEELDARLRQRTRHQARAEALHAKKARHHRGRRRTVHEIVVGQFRAVPPLGQRKMIAPPP